MIRVAFAAILATTPLAAQEMVFDATRIDRCLAAGSELEACIGTAASHCMQETEGGSTTVGMGFCLDREWQVWDERLNTTYQALRQRAREADAEIADTGFTVPSQAEALRDMQRAWITFRDRKCDYVRSQWGGGTGGGPASVECLMSETAHQWRYLEDQTGLR